MSVHGELQRSARRDEKRLQEADLPRLWILSKGLTRATTQEKETQEGTAIPKAVQQHRSEEIALRACKLPSTPSPTPSTAELPKTQYQALLGFDLRFQSSRAPEDWALPPYPAGRLGSVKMLLSIQIIRIY